MSGDRKENGGPAFPNVPPDPQYTKWEEGMTLRDYFAGQIATGLTGSQPFILRMLDEHKNGQVSDAIAFTAYDIADAMLKARKA